MMKNESLTLSISAPPTSYLLDMESGKIDYMCTLSELLQLKLWPIRAIASLSFRHAAVVSP
jgi:hypothetical protein